MINLYSSYSLRLVWELLMINISFGIDVWQILQF